MPRPSRVSLSPEFQMLEQTRREFAEQQDCAVKALALAARIPYADANHLLLASGARQPGTGTRRAGLRDALRRFGTLQGVDERGLIQRFPRPHNNLHHLTTHHPRRFQQFWPSGEFIMFTTNHVLFIADGTVHDWSVNKSLRCEELFRFERNT